MQQAKVILICGYRRTGKDTLCAILSNNNQSTSLFKWRVYRHPSLLTKYITNKNASTYVRTAFADALKYEASQVYSIPLVISDADKDIKQFKHNEDVVRFQGNSTFFTKQSCKDVLRSARDIYIEWGAFRRSQDIDYWCKAAFNNVPNDSTTVCVVTDWRYHNEAKYVIDTFSDVVTVRIYRSDVPEPDADIDSEHNLDDYQTDLLLIQNDIEGEFERVVEKFPQYIQYIPCECI